MMSRENRFVMSSLEGVKLVHPDGTEEYVKDMKLPEEREVEKANKHCFAEYLKAAWTRTRQDADNKCDNGDLEYFNRLCRRGVLVNWSNLEQRSFLEDYHRCIAVISRRVAVVEKFLPSQVVLFRDHDAAKIVAEQELIRAEWNTNKRGLNIRMVNAMIETSSRINGRWQEFQQQYLPLPQNPESESLTDWQQVHQALDRLPMVGPATAWYLLRNLYGAPCFKQDVHISMIAKHFFPNAANSLSASLAAMSESVRELWEDVCEDRRFLPVHLGEVDFVLWWYRQATGLPEIQAIASASC